MLMMDAKSENLPGLLVRANTATSGSAKSAPPPNGEALERRAQHFASCVRFCLDEPVVMRRLHQLTGALGDAPDLSTLLPQVLDGAMALVGADFGNIQLADPETGGLRIAAHSGFGSEFLEYFAVVDDDGAACGRAAKSGEQTVIVDVNTDPAFAPHRAIAAAAGFRAVQSTPLMDYSGRLIGMISTHFQHPYRPPDRELRAMEYYADVAGGALAVKLSPSANHDHDLIGRAMVAALLDPRPGWAASAVIPYELGRTLTDLELSSLQQSPALELLISEFACHVVNKLFSVGLSLESARSMIADSAAGDRVAVAVRDLDQAIRDIRTTVFSMRIVSTS